MKSAKRIALLLLILPIPVVVALSSRSSERSHRLEDITYALKNEDADVRLGAVAALTNYGGSAVPPLKSALNDPIPNVKLAAIDALGKIGGAQAADALAGLLTDPDRNIRCQAIIAMGLAGRPALPHLLKALESEPFPRGRMFAAHAIGEIARPGDTSSIMERFHRQDAATQMHLVIALVKIDDDQAYEALERLIASPDRLVRFYVVNTIAEATPDNRTLPILLDALEDDAVEVRMWAMYGLEQLNHPSSYPQVLAALDDRDPYVRKEAAYTLGNLGNSAAVPLLISRLDDPHYLVRCDSAESLGKLGDPRALEALRPLLQEKNPSVQIRAAEALARFEDYSGMQKLVSITGSPSLLYRVEACRVLKHLSGKDFGLDHEAWNEWWQQNRQKIERDAGEN